MRFLLRFREKVKAAATRVRPVDVRIVPPNDPRQALAQRYIAGSGIEFGALHFPLTVPAGVVVTYADFQSLDDLREFFPDVAGIRAPDIIADLETMHGVGDAGQDFVIANHVLEHVEDPLKALKSIARVLRPAGIAYLALPDKRFTFDKERKVTTLSHLIEDHEKGPDGSLLDHYREYTRYVDGLDGEAREHKVALMLAKRENIHFHVWDFAAMCELFAYVARSPSIPLDLEASMLNGAEVIWVLRKPSEEHSQETASMAEVAEPSHLPVPEGRGD